MRYSNVKSLWGVGVYVCVVLIGYGCAQQGYSVVAMTGTVIGVDIAQNPATQTPHAKLGYNRGELAFVPTNRRKGAQSGASGQNGLIGGGAKDSANVLMELRYGGIFDTGRSSGIYQRLAVGDIAVQQDGASAMFIKDADGKVDENAEKAIRAIRDIPESSPMVEAERAPLSARFLALQKQSETNAVNEFDAAAKAEGYANFAAFARSRSATIAQVRAIRKRLESKKLVFGNP
jgi:hypothetical protein